MTSAVIDRLANAVTGLAIKAPVKAATTGPIAMTGNQTIDGIAVSSNSSLSGVQPDRVLVKNQADATTNGIYYVQDAGWVRAPDFDSIRDVMTGTLVLVVNGTTQGLTIWELSTTDNPIVFGTSHIVFTIMTQLSGRPILIPSTDPSGINVILPSYTARALQFLGFDSSGNVTTYSGTSGGVAVSTAMTPVVEATTIAAALNLLLPSQSGNAGDLLVTNGTSPSWQAPAASGFSTGDVKFTLKTTADTGWIMANDGTIGSASSGATTLADPSAQNLYTLLWNNISNSYAPVTGGRGASAAADWAANKPLQLTAMLGRALAISGAGLGLTSYALGQAVGENTHTLTSTEMPSHTHTINDSGHIHGIQTWGFGDYEGRGISEYASSNPYTTRNTNTASTGISNNNTGGDGAHNNMQPTSFLNAMIKL